MPPCGRRIVYVSPHSPFQKLVESRRQELGLSVRDVANAVTGITGKPELNPGSLWIWLRNQNGFPHPKSATRKRLVAMARVLRTPLPRLEESLDDSRRLFTSREKREPKKSVEALRQFIAIVSSEKRTMIARERVLNIARSLLKSAGG